MRQHEMSPGDLTPGRIVRFWLPLEATWLMMAAEGPFLAAVIARLAAPKENLAAFAVASALAWIVESPIIMMLSASNALVRDGVAYRKLRRFSYALNAAVTAVMIVLVVPPVFDLVARGVMGLAPDVAGLAGRSMFFLVLWPGAIGFRRFYQGILISDGRPQAVTWGTVVRLSTMAATGLLLALAFDLPGASVGAGALGAGVLAEGAASWFMARPTLRRLRRQSDAECAFGHSLTAGRIVRFYAPLALTSFLSFFINPLTTFFLARGRMPLESLAVLPVIVGLGFVFRTAGIAIQEVVIALVGDGLENRAVLRRFSLRVGVLVGARPGRGRLHPAGHGLVRDGLRPRAGPGRLLPPARGPARAPALHRIGPVVRAGHPGQVAPHRPDRRGRRRPAGSDDRGLCPDGPRPEDGRRRRRRPGPDRGLCGRPGRSFGREAPQQRARS